MRYIPRVSLYEGSLNRGSSVKHATVSAWRWGWVKEKIDARTPVRSCALVKFPQKRTERMKKRLAPVVLTLDRAIHRTNHYPLGKYYVVQRTEIYLVDSVIHL